MLVEQRAPAPVALADRSHVLANGSCGDARPEADDTDQDFVAGVVFGMSTNRGDGRGTGAEVPAVPVPDGR